MSAKELSQYSAVVALLQTLFKQLVHSQTAAVAPEYDLAKLALETSREETAEGGDPPKNNLTQEVKTEVVGHVEAPATQLVSEIVCTPSVLGKRIGEDLTSDRKLAHEPDAMDIDPPSESRTPVTQRDASRGVSLPIGHVAVGEKDALQINDRSSTMPLNAVTGFDATTFKAEADALRDPIATEITFADFHSTRPPLPPRRPHAKSPSNASQEPVKADFSSMTFGTSRDRQHEAVCLISEL